MNIVREFSFWFPFGKSECECILSSFFGSSLNLCNLNTLKECIFCLLANRLFILWNNFHHWSLKRFGWRNIFSWISLVFLFQYRIDLHRVRSLACQFLTDEHILTWNEVCVVVKTIMFSCSFTLILLSNFIVWGYCVGNHLVSLTWPSLCVDVLIAMIVFGFTFTTMGRESVHNLFLFRWLRRFSIVCFHSLF